MFGRLRGFYVAYPTWEVCVSPRSYNSKICISFLLFNAFQHHGQLTTSLMLLEDFVECKKKVRLKVLLGTLVCNLPMMLYLWSNIFKILYLQLLWWTVKYRKKRAVNNTQHYLYMTLVKSIYGSPSYVCQDLPRNWYVGLT